MGFPDDAVPSTETLRAEAPGAGRWTVVAGAGAGPRVLPGRGLVLGSGADVDLVVVDRAVSARHARLLPTPAGVRVEDLGSRNGTWVDGIRVERAMVAPGARLRLGRTDVRVRLDVADDATSGREALVARSEAMQGVVAEARRLARLPWPVLVTGETGVGKEEVARALHRFGPRDGAPFVAVNAGGLPRELVESELFGHERGAFTGAVAPRSGLFERAHGGTLFLDEIGELELGLQSRLLRVLELGEVRRVGGDRTRRVDARLVCATHRDLPAEVDAGRFREDLYFRVARTVIQVPPLRHRPEDLDALTTRFLVEVADAVGPRTLDPGARRLLRRHRWPGNARELRNVLCAAAAASPGPRIDASDVALALARLRGGRPGRRPVDYAAVLESHGGNLTAAARAVGLARSTFRDRLVRQRGVNLR